VPWVEAVVSKTKTQFVCGECGGVSPKWQGQCSQCGTWNSLTESRVESGGNRFAAASRVAAAKAPADVSAILTVGKVQAQELPRWSTGSEEFDRVLGGGLVPGGVVLIGGDPGIGKSTLLLQSLAEIARERPALYISGEESGAQIALRAQRLGLLGDSGNAASRHRNNPILPFDSVSISFRCA